MHRDLSDEEIVVLELQTAQRDATYIMGWAEEIGATRIEEVARGIRPRVDVALKYVQDGTLTPRGRR